MKDNTHPGEAIKSRLKDRGWNQSDLARIVGKTNAAINEIIQGKRAITPEMAALLAAAFDEDPGYWLALNASYRAKTDNANVSDVQRRARLFSLAPVRDMERRGWLRKLDDVSALERELLSFFQIDDVSQEPEITASARKRNPELDLTITQRAWCYRALRLATTLSVEEYQAGSLDQCAKTLRELAAFPEEARNVPRVLGEYGIRFLVIEPLTNSRIDGATLWLDDNNPIIVLSVRYDRIDWFWFTLAHEFSHVRHHDGVSVDSALVGEKYTPSIAKIAMERRADNEAADLLIPNTKLQSFIRRVGPLYSKARINQFAQRVQIHPGIVVGQLQHCGEINYSANKEMLEPVRQTVLSASLTDGWGHAIGIV